MTSGWDHRLVGRLIRERVAAFPALTTQPESIPQWDCQMVQKQQQQRDLDLTLEKMDVSFPPADHGQTGAWPEP
jgi:hypothetical protein